MNFFGRSLILLLVLLFFASIYHDITSGTLPLVRENSETESVNEDDNKIYIKVLPGQTVLSVVEKYNDTKSININQIIADFKKLNPDTEAYQIKSYEYYYFPLY